MAVAREPVGWRARLALPLDPLAAGLLTALLAALLIPPIIPYEIAWEVAASLGYAACCAIILSFRLVPLARMAASWPYRSSLHRAAGDAALAFVALHVAVMLATDPYVLDYLGWLMPLHVLAGVLAALALVLAVVTREPLLRFAVGTGGGPRLHAWAGIVAAGLTAAHVLTSSAKLIGLWRYALFGCAFAVLVIPALERLGRRSGWWARRRRQPRPPAARRGPREPWQAGTGDILRLLGLLAALATLFVAVPGLVLVSRGQ